VNEIQNELEKIMWLVCSRKEEIYLILRKPSGMKKGLEIGRCPPMYQERRFCGYTTKILGNSQAEDTTLEQKMVYCQ
jgi:hypothetical protein